MTSKHLIKEDVKLQYDTVVPANTSLTVYIPLRVGNATGKGNVTIVAKEIHGEELVIRREFDVHQINFPFNRSFSSRELSSTNTFSLPAYIDGSLNAELKIYGNTLEELTQGIESIIRGPYGCFEQVLSSAFPNIYALQLLNAVEQRDGEPAKRALTLLQNGYNKLITYEIKETGGFEWFGKGKAHEALSAYGYLHFYELGKVSDVVDEAMIDRTTKFLLNRRDGKGGFHQNKGKYGFSGAPLNVNNAYIVYVFSETQNGDLILPEYEVALKEAIESKDLYRMALLANSTYSMNDLDAYNKPIGYFKDWQSKNKLSTIKVENTVVRGYGVSAINETVAFWINALLKNESTNE